MAEGSLRTPEPLDFDAGRLENSRRGIETEPRALSGRTFVSPMLPARNSNQSINTLPIETFVDIILFAVAEDYERAVYEDNLYTLTVGTAISYYSVLLRYMLVSRRWYGTIVQHPIFWRIVDNSLNPATWPVILARSGEALLHVVFLHRRGTSYGSDDDVLFPEFLRFVSPVSERWVTLLVRAQSAKLPSCLNLLSRPTPRLRRLEFLDPSDPYDDGYPITPLTLPDTLGKDLRHIRIYGIGLKWNSTILSGLTHLHLNHARGDTLTLSRLFQTLLSSPFIQSLVLEGMIFHDDLEGEGWPPFVLPVVNLALRFIPELILRKILLSIQDIPNCAAFCLDPIWASLEEGRDPPTSAFLPSCLRHLLPRLSAVVAGASLRYFRPVFNLGAWESSGTRLELQTEQSCYEGLYIRMLIGDLPDPQTCIWFGKLFSHPSCRHIPFNVRSYPRFNWEDNERRVLFSGMNVVGITAGSGQLTEDVNSLLSYLRRTEAGNDTLPLDYPNLRSLTLNANEFPWKELWETVKIRCQSPNSQNSGQPFRVDISTDKVDREVLGRLKRYLGDMNVSIWTT